MSSGFTVNLAGEMVTEARFLTEAADS